MKGKFFKKKKRLEARLEVLENGNKREKKKQIFSARIRRRNTEK